MCVCHILSVAPAPKTEEWCMVCPWLTLNLRAAVCCQGWGVNEQIN